MPAFTGTWDKALIQINYSANMNRTALITGSTSGIGLAIASAFACAGYDLVFNGLEKNGGQIAGEIAGRHGVRHLFFDTDLRDPAGIREMAGKTLDTFGTVHILVNNAGIQHVSPVEDFPEEKWKDLLSVHLDAAFLLSKAFLPAMKRAKSGRIINIASAHGLIASPYKSAYVAAKHAIVGFTKALAMEGGPFGITANAICPGYVLTPLVEKQIPEQMNVHGLSREEVVEKIFLKEHAVKEFVTPEAIAAVALFLADSEAAPFITGTAFPVDAGWTAH